MRALILCLATGCGVEAVTVLETGSQSPPDGGARDAGGPIDPPPSRDYGLVRLAVLDDLDPDYSTPPFGDRLTIMDVRLGEATVVREVTDLNLSQSIGASRQLSARHGALVSVEIAANRMSLRDASGSEIVSVPGWITAGDATRERMYAAWGTDLNNGRIQAYDRFGMVVAETAEIFGFDLVVDEVRGVVWTVGASLSKSDAATLSMNRTIARFGWAAVSIDVAADGSVWVVERREGSHQLHHFGFDGEALGSYPLSSDPYCVRIDPSTQDIWVAEEAGITRFDRLGREQLRIGGTSYWSLAVVPGHGVWATTRIEDSISFFARDGIELDRRRGFSTSEKYVAILDP